MPSPCHVNIPWDTADNGSSTWVRNTFNFNICENVFYKLKWIWALVLLRNQSTHKSRLFFNISNWYIQWETDVSIEKLIVSNNNMGLRFSFLKFLLCIPLRVLIYWLVISTWETWTSQIYVIHFIVSRSSTGKIQKKIQLMRHMVIQK